MRWSLRTQLVLLGLGASVLPLLVLLLVVVQVVDNTEVEEVNGEVVLDERTIDLFVMPGISPWIPIAALVLALGSTVLVLFWSRAAVRPIETMTDLTNELQANSLNERLDLDGAPIEIQRLGQSFDSMLERLSLASTRERELIEEASHELRTPLAALMARLEVAARQTDLARMSEDIQRCEQEADRLNKTLDLLLNAARVRNDQLTQTNNDVAAIVRRVIEQRAVVSPSIEFSFSGPERLLAGVDGTAIHRAIANLVDNAVQHGGGAPVSVAVTESGGSIEIAVTDSGPGIEAARLPRIFDRYSGENNGIGLAIVKQVADVYGSISVDSPLEDGAGCRFVLAIATTDDSAAYSGAADGFQR